MDLEDCPSLTSQCYLCLFCSLARDPMSLLPELQTMQSPFQTWGICTWSPLARNALLLALCLDDAHPQVRYI